MVNTKKTKEELNAAFEKEYEIKEQQKNVIIQALSALELEDMLRTSTKNVAHEVVSCLVEPTSRGVLTDIIRWLTTSQQNMLNDHLSILDSSELSQSNRFNNYGDEDPEDSEDAESFYNTKSSINSSGIRIKVRKSSVDPHAKNKSWINKTHSGAGPHGSKHGTSAVRKSKHSPNKTKKEIDLTNENVRAGSPLNYVRDKSRKNQKGASNEDEDENKKDNLIVMRPTNPID